MSFDDHCSFFKCLWLKRLNLTTNSSMIELEQEMVSRRKVSELLKNFPGKIITFSSAYSLLQN